MKLTKNIIIFLVFNFAALSIGSFFTGEGATSDWYYTLEKAPWSPPGWVFGLAWTTIMICYSIYMGILYKVTSRRKEIIVLYSAQLLLNIAWNPFFFYFQNALISLIDIISLTFIVAYFLFSYRKTMRWYSLLILPYFLWLCIATSLNLYIVLYN